jgi:hypothetical protein
MLPQILLLLDWAAGGAATTTGNDIIQLTAQLDTLLTSILQLDIPIAGNSQLDTLITGTVER